jgi:protein phosphatase
VRGNNEDNLYCGGVSLTPENRDTPFCLTGSEKPPCVFAVCDGMGGQNDGETASLTAVSVLAQHTKTILASLAGDIDFAVQSYVTRVNAVLCDKMRAKSVRMGTTLALVVIAGNAIHAYSIGDSRIYLLKNGELRQISKDHTVAEQKIELGILTRDEARAHKDRHKLTNCLGVFEDEMTAAADVIPAVAADAKCRLLICTDGLTDMVDDRRIRKILLSARGAGDAGRLLTESAHTGGGEDNVTCVVLDITRDKRRRYKLFGGM